jgi:signal transduction histidine kinase
MDYKLRTMRLADFILENMEEILQSWEDFAKTISSSAETMGARELRDHAEQMLKTIAADLRTSQTAQERVTKSHGDGPRKHDETAAEDHASARLVAGFSIDQMVSEYRALRTSVLLLWSKHANGDPKLRATDTMRFHEAIDQALAESIASYSRKIKEAQNIFLGILGHDLRTPLGAILLGAEALLRSEELDSRHTKIASRIYSSVNRAEKIVENLLDFTRSRLGGGIPVKRTKTDLAIVCEAIVDEARVYHADRTILADAQPGLIGQFDAARLEQVFSNLISNAVQHGSEMTPVTVNLHRENEQAVFRVHNEGDPILEKDLPRIFDSMSRHSTRRVSNGRGSGLGLGLYIAHEIVTAHGGTIEVYSKEGQGTTFLVKLPL